MTNVTRPVGGDGPYRIVKIVALDNKGKEIGAPRYAVTKYGAVIHYCENIPAATAWLDAHWAGGTVMPNEKEEDALIAKHRNEPLLTSCNYPRETADSLSSSSGDGLVQ
jgi:hypothetical protein